MTVYDLTMLDLAFTDVDAVLSALGTYLDERSGEGTLLACLRSEFGALNRIMLLRAFAGADALAADRLRVRQDADPFGCGEAIIGLGATTFAPFSGFPEPRTGQFGPLYEVRSYGVKPGRLADLMSAWAEARAERDRHSPFLLAMYSLDGPLRITHMWGYSSLDARQHARVQAAQGGAWPPPVGPSALEPGHMESAVYLPAAFSPLN